MSTTAAPGPFGLFERMLALRYLRATRKGAGVSVISIIAFLGIMLSVATLIVVMSVMQGFRVTLLDQLLGVNGHVFVQPPGNSLPASADLLANLEAVDGVVAAVPVLKVEAYAVAGRDGQTPVYIQGVTRDDLFTIDEVTGPQALRQGSFEGFGAGPKGGNAIIMAVGVAAKLGVGAGDTVTLITGGGAETPFGVAPTTEKSYQVAAIFAVGNSEYDGILVYMPLQQAQLFARRRGEISEIELKVADPLDIEHHLPMIQEAAGPSVFILDWRQRFRSLFNALEVERGLQRLILLMIVGIATLNIISGLVMLVKDKTSDIAVLRTVGATSGAILRIFLMVGGLIGVTGAVFGVALGSFLATNLSAVEEFLSTVFGFRLFNPEIYYLDEIPSIFEFSEVRNVLLFALLMALLSAAYPAWRASRLDPVEALRYE
ncbi:MAG: lipoprotein-releasing ABC transporter permease subunit [Pseudomonadota bacterium]